MVDGAEIVTFAAGVATWPKDRGRLAEEKGLPISNAQNGCLEMNERLLDAVLVAPFVLTMVGFAVAIAGNDAPIGYPGACIAACLLPCRLGLPKL
jgi:hypothetical protein